MEQTKSFFIINKYKSVMYSALAIELVTYLVSLTDTLVAGNMIDQEALVAIGLMGPFSTAATFLSAVLNSGTILNYTRSIGEFEGRRANEIFCHGCILAVGTGVLFAAIMLAGKDLFMRGMGVSADTRAYLEDYFSVIIWFYLFMPLCTILDNTIMSNGGEKVSAAANIVQTVSNVILSVVLSRFFGVKGIAAGSVLCQFIAMGMISSWFFGKRSTVRIILSIHFQDFLIILRDGFGRSAAFALSALMVWMMNRFTLVRFGSDAVAIFVVVTNIVESALIFMGLSLALQPFIGTLRGEKNSKAERQLLKEACRFTLIGGAAASAVAVVFAPLLAAAFGFGSDPLYPAVILSVRIAGSTLFARAVLMLFFVYYFLTDRRTPMFLITILSDFAAPIALGIFGALFLGRPEGIWAGVAAAPVFSLLVCAVFVLCVYGRKSFPFLIPAGDESRIYIYDFMLNNENSVAMSETAGEILMAEGGFAMRTVRMLELIVEDTLMLIQEKNRDMEGELSAECNIILGEDGARLILRDSGIIFDITDSDASIDSFRQYFIGQVLTIPNNRHYITSAGYNRSEFFFTREKKEA